MDIVPCRRIVPLWEAELLSSPAGQLSVLRPLVRCYWSTYLTAGLVYFSKVITIAFCQECEGGVQVLLQLVSPQIISLFIAWVEEDQQQWKAVVAQYHVMPQN